MILINHELKYNSNIGYKKFYRHIQIESSFNHVWIHQTINKLPNFITINQTSSHNGGTNTFFFFALLTPSTVKFLRYTRPSPKKSTRNPSKCQGNRPEWFRANKLCRKVACVCVQMVFASALEFRAVAGPPAASPGCGAAPPFDQSSPLRSSLAVVSAFRAFRGLFAPRKRGETVGGATKQDRPQSLRRSKIWSRYK